MQLTGLDLQDSTKSSRVALRWLEQNENWLIILDNVTPDIIAPLLPSSGSGHILATSNDPHWTSITSHHVRLHGLSSRDAVQFLKSRTGNENQSAALRVVTKLGSLPLALQQAAAYIETTGIDFESYEQLLEQNCPALLDKKSPFTEYPESVYSALPLNVQRVVASVSDAVILLIFVSYLSSSNIPRKLARNAIHTYLEQRQERYDDFIFNELVLALPASSLIVAEADVVSTHPLVQSFVLDNLLGDTENDWARLVVGVLVDHFPVDVEDSSTWPKCESLIDHVTTAVRLTNYQSWDDELIESLYVRAGSYYMREVVNRNLLSY